jgi:hypothetical protein
MEKFVWSGSFFWPNRFRYNCDFLLISNKSAAYGLQNELPALLEVQGFIECNTVWSYLDGLRGAWTKQIITLLMHPPTGNLQKYVFNHVRI